MKKNRLRLLSLSALLLSVSAVIFILLYVLGQREQPGLLIAGFGALGLATMFNFIRTQQEHDKK